MRVARVFGVYRVCINFVTTVQGGICIFFGGSHLEMPPEQIYSLIRVWEADFRESCSGEADSTRYLIGRSGCLLNCRIDGNELGGHFIFCSQGIERRV